MKSFQLITVLFAFVLLDSTCAIDSEWEPIATVEIPRNAATHQSNGLRRVQSVDVPTIESTSTASASDASGSAPSSTTETEAPATVMVLLPDNLAMSYSGSGSVMFYDGTVGKDDKSEGKSASSDKTSDEVSGLGSAHSIGMATTVTALTTLFAFMMA